MASLVASESSGGFSDSGGIYTVYSLVERVKINGSVRTFERIFSSIACGVKSKTGKKKNELMAQHCSNAHKCASYFLYSRF